MILKGSHSTEDNLYDGHVTLSNLVAAWVSPVLASLFVFEGLSFGGKAGTLLCASFFQLGSTHPIQLPCNQAILSHLFPPPLPARGQANVLAQGHACTSKSCRTPGSIFLQAVTSYCHAGPACYGIECWHHWYPAEPGLSPGVPGGNSVDLFAICLLWSWSLLYLSHSDSIRPLIGIQGYSLTLTD